MAGTVSFADLYRDYYDISRRFVISYVRDEPVAEDIVSDAFFKLYEAMKCEEVLSPHALLVTILRNESLNHLKHEQVKQIGLESIATHLQRDLNYRILSLEACNPQQLFFDDIETIVRQTLKSLPSQTGKVFCMSRYEHLSTKEIATRTRLSTKSVEYHITQALRAMRVALRDYLI